ncbi:MAG: hypothetical protein RLY43_578, partial [Bacteroidota bacterium]
MEKFIEFMKRNYKSLVVVAVLSALLWGFIPFKKQVDGDKDKMLMELLTFVLDKGHYAPIKLDDDFSKKAYASYIESLDPTKRFFLQADIEEFQAYETSIDDMLEEKNLTFFNLTYSRLLKRMDESKKLYAAILSKPLNFNENETLDVNYEKIPFAAS